MKRRLLPWSCLVLLGTGLISCDRKETTTSGDNPGGFNTRSNRPAREGPRVGSRKDFDAALQAAHKLPSAAERDQAIATLAREHLADYPELADRAIRELATADPGSAELPALIEAYVATLPTQDPAAALKWADSLADPAVRAAARELVVAAVPESEVGRAASQLLDSGRLAADGFDSASLQLYQRWIATAPQDAAEWILRLPAGEARTAGIRSLANQRLLSDPAATFQWLAEQTAAPVRQEVAQALAQVLAETPEPIRQHFLTPASPALRDEIERHLAPLLPKPAEPPTEPPATEAAANPAAGGDAQAGQPAPESPAAPVPPNENIDRDLPAQEMPEDQPADDPPAENVE